MRTSALLVALAACGGSPATADEQARKEPFYCTSVVLDMSANTCVRELGLCDGIRMNIRDIDGTETTPCVGVEGAFCFNDASGGEWCGLDEASCLAKRSSPAPNGAVAVTACELHR